MLYFLAKEADENLRHSEQTRAARRVLLLGLRLEYKIDKLPEIAKDTLGKPYFAETGMPCFNYSHCHAGILCGISRGQIGVDVETVRVIKTKMIERICHPKELEILKSQPDAQKTFMKFWTAKEAYLKYLGTGIRRDLRSLDFSGICSGDVQNEDGSMVRLWEQENVCMCACARMQEDLVLHQLSADEF